jgi:queuine tRNA-ribosyltransferase
MPPSRLDFQLQARASGSRARAATFRTLHGVIQTPLFMPVGTQATVKAQTPESLAASGSQILLANTYHLLLRPGPEVFEKMGGIHRFMKWPGSVLTDSGGYQIFSLPHSRSMTEKGAVFQSYVDNRRILLSPELSIQTQRSIGSDIMMVLDQCIPSTADEKTARKALQVTQRWAARSLAAREDSPQSLFAIVQGALYPHLRKESAAGLVPMPFDGFAIGGLAVGEEKHQREDVCELTAAMLPEDRPRYLMGVGMPIDLLEAVHRGMDMFDCIIPTQVAKRGTAFTSRGIVELRRSACINSPMRRWMPPAPARCAPRTHGPICIISRRRRRRSAGRSSASTTSTSTTSSCARSVRAFLRTASCRSTTRSGRSWPKRISIIR